MKKIPFRTDSSNADDSYLRNHIRLNIVPEFDKINPNFRNNLDDLMVYFKELQIHLEKNSKIIIKEDTHFEADDFQKLDSFAQKELIAHIYRVKNS